MKTLSKTQIENEYSKQKQKNLYEFFVHSPYAIEKEISKYISNGNKEYAFKTLKRINSVPHAKLASTDLRSYKNSMICSCAYMTRAAIEGGVNPDNAFTLSDTYINNIENLNTLEQLQSFEYTMVEGFSNLVYEEKSKKYSHSIRKAINYIDNNLNAKLTISKIAHEVYLNPCYLSVLFHKETGKTISDWILEKRIEGAKNSIINTNKSFSEISFIYQFSSQSYFVQCFKKIVGITPGEFRRLH